MFLARLKKERNAASSFLFNLTQGEQYIRSLLVLKYTNNSPHRLQYAWAGRSLIDA